MHGGAPQREAQGGSCGWKPDQLDLLLRTMIEGGRTPPPCTRRVASARCGPACKWRTQHTTIELGRRTLPSLYCADNELIINPESWVSNLPHTITACFYPSNAPKDKIAYTRKVHKDFLARYKLTAEVVPLLRYNPGKGFELAPNK